MEADATNIHRADASEALRVAGDGPETTPWAASWRRSLSVSIRPLLPDGLGLFALALCLAGLLAMVVR